VPPLPTSRAAGCSFAARCRHRDAVCDDVEPDLERTGAAILVACHRPLAVRRTA
jgi:ABC-type dipeptide/oligopeptide/nickel transport system ATPase component